MNNEKRITRALKSEAVILALVPFIGSVIAFSFEAGYLLYFGVPLEFIELGLQKVIQTLIILSIVLSVLWIIGSKVIAVVISGTPAIKNTYLLLFVVGISVFVWKTSDKTALLYSLIWPTILIVSYGVHSLFAGNGFLRTRTPALADAYDDGQKVAVTAVKLSDAYIVPFSIFFMVLLAVTSLGSYVARMDGQGWLLRDGKEYLLVRKYGDTYLFKEFDSKTMVLGKGVRLVKLSEGKNITLEKVLLTSLSHGEN